MRGTFILTSQLSLSVGGPGCAFEGEVHITTDLQFCWDDFANIGLSDGVVCANEIGECSGTFSGVTNAWIVSSE